MKIKKSLLSRGIELAMLFLLFIVLVLVIQGVQQDTLSIGTPETLIIESINPYPPPVSPTVEMKADTQVIQPYPPPPYSPPGTFQTPYPTKELKQDSSNLPTLPPTTPNPISYSITSTDKWFTYTNLDYKFSLKYPETPPIITSEKFGELTWIRVSVNIRTGPTLPASPVNRASIEIHIYPNFKQIPLKDFVNNLESSYGSFTTPLDNQNALLGKQYLLSAGADSAFAYVQQNDSRLFYAASHQNHIYIFGEGYITQSPEQSQVFKLILSSFLFLDE